MRRWLLFALACLACVPALAQERSYAIVSLVGDGLLIVQREMSTGSRIDRNRREVMTLANPVLDNTMVLAIDDGMHAVDNLREASHVAGGGVDTSRSRADPIVVGDRLRTVARERVAGR